MWNTTEGGPCVLRPISSYSFDAPNGNKIASRCVTNLNEDGTCKYNRKSSKCKDVICNDMMVEVNAKLAGTKQKITEPWIEYTSDELRDLALDFAEGYQDRLAAAKERTPKTLMKKIMDSGTQAWNNQFAFAWEIGLFWNLTTDYSTPGQRPSGCKGLDAEFGTVQPPSNFNPRWPLKNTEFPIFASPAMDCGLNNYAPEGKPVHSITDDYATDSDKWQPKFLEAWHIMTTNGYKAEDLEDGPENAWFGHTSLTRQNIKIKGRFAKYILKRAPLTFTDPSVRQFILCVYMMCLYSIG